MTDYIAAKDLSKTWGSMLSNSSAFNGVNFSINLAKELKRVSINDVKDLRFEAKDFLFFNPDEINPFPSLPDNVSLLSYRLDYSELTPLNTSTTEGLLIKY